MHFSEEEIHEDTESPEKDIVDPIRHGGFFFVVRRLSLLLLRSDVLGVAIGGVSEGLFGVGHGDSL